MKPLQVALLFIIVYSCQDVRVVIGESTFLERYNSTSISDIVNADGYPFENHYVTTGDGYILNIHRIPFGKTGETNNKVAYLQHGLLCSSAHWVLNGPEKSLAYILADEGYDVWMGNSRGNSYSRNHTTLDPNTDSRFWQFSWHEIGVIDVPATIDFILGKTGVNGVYYVGHSQGTTVYYVMASSKPEYNSKIKAQVSLAPIAYIGHMTSPLLRIIALWQKPISALLKLIGKDEFLPSKGFVSMLSDTICTEGVGSLLCGNVLFAICGFSPKQMNLSEIPIIVAHSPAGVSTKQILHYGQEISSKKFRQYDFGTIQNLRKYGSVTPPSYDLKRVTAPTYLIYSRNDWLAAVVDVKKLYRELGGEKAKFLVSDHKFNHLDYLFGIDADELVYSNVISSLRKH